jgi:hypothetical protein
VDAFLSNAQEIFDVASSGHGGDQTDFALLIRPDGGLHLIMDTPFTLDAAAASEGAQVAYRVTRTDRGVRVCGQNGNRTLVLEKTTQDLFRKELLRDRPLYRMTSPRLISSAPSIVESCTPVTNAMFRANRGEFASTIPQST